MLVPGKKPDPELLISGNPKDLNPEQKLERFQELKALNKKVNIFFQPEGEYIIEPTANNDEYKWTYYENQPTNGQSREISQMILTYDKAKNVLNKTVSMMIVKESKDPVTKKLTHPLDLESIILKTRQLLSPQLLDVKWLLNKHNGDSGYELKILERKPKSEIQDEELRDKIISDEEAIQYYSNKLLTPVREEKVSDETSIRKVLADIWSEKIR